VPDLERGEDVDLPLQPFESEQRAVAREGKPISTAFARNAFNSSSAAVGVSRSDDSSPIAANGLTADTLPGLRRDDGPRAGRFSWRG
jgi:hypothetical protein